MLDVSHLPSVDQEKPIAPDVTDRLQEISASYYGNEGGCHAQDHVERVRRTAGWIGRQMKARLDVLDAAALLHDIGRPMETASQGRTCHAQEGAAMAEKILQELCLDRALIDAICHCIATHRFRRGNPPASLEAMILFDADKLDSIGAVGIGRAFLFAGQVGARLHNSEKDIHETVSYSLEDTAYREFMVKLHKVRDRMLTPAGRMIAGERHSFMELFFRQLEREIRTG